MSFAGPQRTLSGDSAYTRRRRLAMLTSTLRLTICLALAGGVLAAVAAPAQAANIAPNSEFANCTGGVPDQWSAATGSQIACVNDGNGDTTGVSLTDPGDNSFIETMVSACIAPTGGDRARPDAGVLRLQVPGHRAVQWSRPVGPGHESRRDVLLE